MDAMERVARQWHVEALADPLVSHAFSHGYADDHVERLACYLGEALGGPDAYTRRYGAAAHVDRLHAGNGSHEEMDAAAIAAFARAVRAAGVPEPAASALLDYWAWATCGPMAAHPDSAASVPAAQGVHRYGWDGPTTNADPETGPDTGPDAGSATGFDTGPATGSASV